MSINELPVEVLALIFKNIDLMALTINCTKVSQKWRETIAFLFQNDINMLLNNCLTLFEVVSSKSGQTAFTIQELALFFNFTSPHKI